MEATQAVEYLSLTDTAKLMRSTLKRQFPGVKFSVRSSSFSMGSAIDVSWTDGPTQRQVEAVISAYAYGGFDGSIDMSYSSESWLEEDGSASFAYTGGTEGSRGSVPEAIGSRRTGGARLVHMGAKYVHANRKHSDAFLAQCAELVQRNGIDGTFGQANAERCDSCGDWKRPEDPCFVAEGSKGHRDDAILFVCSPTCGARSVARSLAAEA